MDAPPLDVGGCRSSAEAFPAGLRTPAIEIAPRAFACQDAAQDGAHVVILGAVSPVPRGEPSIEGFLPMRSFGRGPDLLLVVAVTALIPWLSAVAADQLQPFEDSIDPAGAFAYVSVHHVCQLLLTLCLMRAFAGTTWSTWGFNLHEWRRSLRITGWFCLVYLGPVFLANVLPYLLSGDSPRFDQPLTARNIGGHLGFQFLLSGSCEEPLFRGFVVTFLAQSWIGRFRVGRATISSATLWATFFFMAGHAQISLHPFAFSVSWPQQAWALGLGLYYGVVFEKTKSLLAPILSHGYSNGVIFVVLYSWALLAR